jgi:hypothetical protein
VRATGEVRVSGDGDGEVRATGERWVRVRAVAVA